MRRSLLLTVIVWLACAAFATSASASELLLDTEPFEHASKVSVLDGDVVWSSYDATAKRSRLMHWSNGVASALPVTPRKGPFDADLGRDGAGNVVVTYSRCGRDPTPLSPRQWPWHASARRCRLYELRLGDRHERRLGPAPPHGRSWMMPSRWGGNVVFFDSPDGRSGGAVRWLKISAPRGLRTLPRGPRSVEISAGPTAIDVRGQRVAYDWRAEHRHNCRDATGDPDGPAYSLDVFSGWLRVPRGLGHGLGPVGLTELGCTFDPIRQAFSPSLDPNGLSYVIEGRWNGETPVLRTRTTAQRMLDMPIDRTDGAITSASVDAGLVAVSRLATGDAFAWEVVLIDTRGDGLAAPP
jgi:hypothetical protein